MPQVHAVQAVQPVKLLRYSITVPGLPGGAFFLDWPEGAPPPVITASERVVAENPVVPLSLRLPSFIPRRRPSEAIVIGKPRVLSACIMILLESVKRGDKLWARPETLRKFAAELPEFAGCLVRDDSRKCHSGLIPCVWGGVEIS